MRLACTAYVQGQEFYDTALTAEIDEVRAMCRTNMGGYWELAFLPYSGGFYEQPAPELERILLIIKFINRAIYNKNKKEG